jgi:hypothetical protein
MRGRTGYHVQLPPRVPCQYLHQPGERSHSRPPEMAIGDAFQRSSTAPHLVWGRVVPDSPDSNTLWSTGAKRPAPRLCPFLHVPQDKVRQGGPYGDAEGQPRDQPRNALAVHLPTPSVLIRGPKFPLRIPRSTLCGWSVAQSSRDSLLSDETHDRRTLGVDADAQVRPCGFLSFTHSVNRRTLG